MGLAIIFLLGIGNFALNRAVLESGHPMLSGIVSGRGMITAQVMLGIEFVLLLAALLLVYNGHGGWGWAYGIYSLVNGFTGWLILTRRV